MRYDLCEIHLSKSLKDRKGRGESSFSLCSSQAISSCSGILILSIPCTCSVISLNKNHLHLEFYLF